MKYAVSKGERRTLFEQIMDGVKQSMRGYKASFVELKDTLKETKSEMTCLWRTFMENFASRPLEASTS